MLNALNANEDAEHPVRHAALPPPNLISPEEQAEEIHVLSFALGEQVYGLEVAHIYEVSRMVAITKSPDSPPDMLGVIDYRGTVVPVVDLQARFSGSHIEINLMTPIILAWTGKHAVGLVIQAIREVSAIAREDLMAPEDFGQHRGHIAGVATIDSGLLLILNPAGLAGDYSVL